MIGLVSLFNLVIGFYFFVHQSILMLALFLPFFVIVLLYNIFNYGLMAQYPGFSLKSHSRKIEQFKKSGSLPRVAVMIPAAGEDVSVVEATTRAALRMTYGNYKVFVLDDSKDGMYQNMVRNAGASYFRRQNRGHHKKAGNLNALLANIKGYDYGLVLDADFVPRPEMLDELLPYAGPDVSIVQSPQDFELNQSVYKRSKFEYGAALIQRDFYRITQVARNNLSGAICVGTNALYNLKAIDQVGGYEGVSSHRNWGHSEDVHTGLKTLNTENEDGQRYRIVYVPVALARGTCPDDHLSFYKQQNRWATGSMQLIFSKKTFFSKKLDLSQKFCYFSNSMYYFYTMAMLLSPLQLLALTLSDVTYSWYSTLLFLPSLMLHAVVIPFVLRRPVRPIAASIVVLSNAYTFVQALFLLAIKRPLGWEATGAKSKPKKHTQFIMFKTLCTLCFLLVYLLTLGVLIINHKIGFNPSMIIVGVFIIGFVSHLIYLHQMYMTNFSVRSAHRNPHAYSYAFVLSSLIAVIGMGYIYGNDHSIRMSSEHVISIVDRDNGISVVSND